MDENDVPSGRYTKPQERLTRLAGAMTSALEAHPENGDDIRGAFMIHDDAGGSGAALYGYPEGQETSFEALADVVQHISVLFKSAGIEMELNTVTREREPDLLDDLLGAPEPEQRIVLTITKDPPDPKMKTVCDAVKAAIEGTSGMSNTKMIIIMDLDDHASAVMHHGFADHHAMVHALFDTFRQAIAAEGGQIAVIPVMDPGTLN